jgi:hypothetical protein
VPQQDSIFPHPQSLDTFTIRDVSAPVFIDETNTAADSVLMDSLVQTEQVSQSKYEDTFFSDKKQSDNLLLPDVRSIMNTDWITIHLVISLCLIAYVQIYYGKRFRQILKAFIGTRYLHMLTKEGNIYRERFSIPLVIVYLISFSLLLFLVLKPYIHKSAFDITGLKLFSVIILSVIIGWFIKNIVISFVGNLFNNYLILTDYLHTNFVFNMIIGVILLPIIIIAVFLPSSEIAYAGIITWLSIYLYRIIRQVFMSLSYRKFSLLYRILYLCTFELIPLLVLTKLVMNVLT